MAHTGQRGEAGKRSTRDGSSGEAAAPPEVRGPGQLAIDDLMRVWSGERPRSVWARVFGISPIGPECELLFARALGERAVGEVLAQLGPGWSVLHSISVGGDGARLDHLVAGPAGVFTVTTRYHPGVDITVSGMTVLVGGMKVAHIRDAEHDLGRAERRLGAVLGGTLVVTGLLVFVRPASLTIQEAPKDVHVLPSSELLPWFEAQPDVYDGSEVERIVSAAKLPATWDSPADARVASAAGELDVLLRLVERSRSVRQLWFGVAIIVVVVTATALATLAILGVAPGGAS